MGGETNLTINYEEGEKRNKWEVRSGDNEYRQNSL